MPSRCGWAPSTCCVLPSGGGADVHQTWLACNSAIQLGDVWLARTSCCPPFVDSDLCISNSRVSGVLVGSSRSCSSSCRAPPVADDDGLVELPPDLVNRLAQSAPAVALESSVGPAAASQRMSHDTGIVRPPKSRVSVFEPGTGKRLMLDSCLRTNSPLPRLKVHWNTSGTSALEEAIFVQHKRIPAEGESRPVPEITHNPIADAVWHPSRSRSMFFAQAQALRNA